MSPARDFKILRKEYPGVWNRMLELYLLSLESNIYRTTDMNRPQSDLKRIMGISSKRARKKEWIPPEGLTFWRSDS